MRIPINELPGVPDWIVFDYLSAVPVMQSAGLCTTGCRGVWRKLSTLTVICPYLHEQLHGLTRIPSCLPAPRP